ncbi:MAG: right-handed parallel beta-helix repeat-containing protein [Planctomycetota bacterium]
MGRPVLLAGGLAAALAFTCACAPARRPRRSPPVDAAPAEAEPAPGPVAEAKGDPVPDAPSSDVPKRAMAPGPCISPEGDDGASGTAEKPFATLGRALRELTPGETIHLLPGRYTDPIVITGARGTKEKPITIAASAAAVFDGTRKIEAQWTKWRNGIWKAQIDFDVWQLFIDSNLVYLARWPDASFEDGSIWRMAKCMRNTDHGWDRKRKAHKGRTRPGLIYDAPFTGGGGGEFREGDAGHRGEANTQSLAASGKDFTGALAVLNSGHWLTWTRPVTKHGAGSDHFTYAEAVEGLPARDKPVMRKNVVYYVLGLAALDRENEWWSDAGTKTVYLTPPGGADPNGLDVRGKIRDHGIALKDCAHVTFRGLRLFGQGFDLNGCDGVRFEDCVLEYPATNRFVLGEFRIINAGRPGYASTVRRTCRRVEFMNCEFAFSNAPVYLTGKETLVENCLFHDIEWDVNSSGGCGSVVTGESAVLRRCTIARCGNAEGLRPAGAGNTIELCHIYDVSNLQHDGAAINLGTRVHARAFVARNWTHDSNRQGVRFDYAGEKVLGEDGRIYGDGVYVRNVVWNTQPSQVKGDRHIVLNNVAVNTTKWPDQSNERMNMGVMGFKAMHGLDLNGESLTRNNIANLAHRSWNFNPRAKVSAYKIPGVEDHNMRERGAAFRHLRDPANWDFRPRKGSPFVDGGATVARAEVKSTIARFERLEFEGKAPDIGAYEPVPRDGARGVPPDADLMFLEAYGCTRHRVSFGAAPAGLKVIAELADDSTNIVKPPPLEAGAPYLWRVDAFVRGAWRKGEVWGFTVRAGTK